MGLMVLLRHGMLKQCTLLTGEKFFLAYGGGYWSTVKAYHKNGNRPLDKFIHTALKYVTKKNNKDPTAIKLKKRLQKLGINQE